MSARRLQSPLGQGEALHHWLRLARSLQLPHGVAITGARGSGKSTLAAWLIAALLCPTELDDDGPCGICRVCTKIANDAHPDVQLLDLAQDEQDKKQGKKSFYVLTVEQVRQAQQALARTAVEGRARIAWIRAADHLDEEGQNALLKTLEEPGERTFLLLEASMPEHLLPTVRSRVQSLRVLPLADSAIAAELAKRLPTRAEHHAGAIAVAGGSLGLALAACTEQVVQLHDLVRLLLARPDRLRPVATARAVLATADERRLEVDQAQQFLWLLRAELGHAQRSLAAAADGSYVAASTEPWTTWLELTLAAERDLDLLIPPEQVLTACLLQFLPS
jgi:energy-coupling factor transporter ATP-binding protein EcfA2